MHTQNVTTIAREIGFATGDIKISRGLFSDCVDINPIAAAEWNVDPWDRVESLLQRAASVLKHYPSGTQSASFIHFRHPACGHDNAPIGIVVHAHVIDQGSAQPYLLLSLKGETAIAFAA